MSGVDGSAARPGAEVRTPDDALLGTVGAVIGHGGAGGAAWASVDPAVGVDRDAPVVVPLANAVTEEDAVRLPFGQETVLGAPQPAVAGAVTRAEEAELASWYGAFASSEVAEGWVAPQDLPDVPFVLEDGSRTP